MKSFCRTILVSVSLLAFAGVASAQYDDAPETTNDASLGVRISQLQEQIRALEGKVEQVSYENKQLKTQLEKSNGDIQYRLGALEKSHTTTPVAEAPVSSTAPVQPQDNGQDAPDTSQLQPVEQAESIPGNTDAPKTPLPSKTYANARDLYTHALGLVNHANYAEGGAEFTSFTQRYPHDPLIGNAYYWLGETQYVRRDYTTAANSFRLGYESMPTGPKASENLLKLAMSLDAMNKDKEACVVLKQVIVKFGSSSSSVKQRSESEINRIGCN
jgi:tol-pal system protein YbgF